jgi:hypothetical protein
MIIRVGSDFLCLLGIRNSIAYNGDGCIVNRLAVLPKLSLALPRLLAAGFQVPGTSRLLPDDHHGTL